jgi:hypothetical protein
MILKAILKINPDAKVSVIDTGNINTSTIEWLEGTTPIPVADIQAQIPVVEQDMVDSITKKANDKASADAKLKALGLTDDEIEAFRS